MRQNKRPGQTQQQNRHLVTIKSRKQSFKSGISSFIFFNRLVSISWLIASSPYTSYPHTYKLAILQWCRIFTGLRFMCSLLQHHQRRHAHQAFALSGGHPSIYPFSITAYPTLRVAGVDGVHPGCLGAKSDKSAVYHRANTVRQTSHTHVHTYRQFRVGVYPNVFGKSLQTKSGEDANSTLWGPV